MEGDALKYILKVGLLDMPKLASPGDQYSWHSFEKFLIGLDPNVEYLPGDLEWYLYLIECKEEDLTLIKLYFPLVHIEHEGLVSFSPHR
jgi:hypothetical protein